MSESYQRVFRKSIVPKIGFALADRYGREKGNVLYARCGERLLALISEADDRGNAAIHRHLVKNILPVAGCYQVLQENGVPKTEACDLVIGQMHGFVRGKTGILCCLSHVPRLYPLFRRICRNAMKKDYPDVGWDVRWIRDDPEGIAFDCRACVYWDTTSRLGCPELCKYFCRNDDILYCVLSPGIRFVRTQTLGTGGNRCDFCFLNEKERRHKR